MLKIENEENAAANDLALVILNRNKERASQAESFFEKYMNAGRSTKKKTSATKTTKKAKKKI